jgi:hypothetical protein
MASAAEVRLVRFREQLRRAERKEQEDNDRAAYQGKNYCGFFRLEHGHILTSLVHSDRTDNSAAMSAPEILLFVPVRSGASLLVRYITSLSKGIRFSFCDIAAAVLPRPGQKDTREPHTIFFSQQHGAGRPVQRVQIVLCLSHTVPPGLVNLV